MKTDGLFHRLFHDWLELAGCWDPTLPGYTLHAAEVKRTALWLDGVLTPPPEPPDWLPVNWTQTR